MTPEDYMDFVSCRAVGFLYKGRKVLCKWLNISKNVCANKTLMELITLIAKTAFRRVIEETIRNRSPNKILHIIETPLQPSELEPHVSAEIKIIKDKLSKVFLYIKLKIVGKKLKWI